MAKTKIDWSDKFWKSQPRSLEIGRCYLFESGTRYWLGRVVSIDGPYAVVLEDASWVANTGRLSTFLQDGKADQMEIEPVGVIGVTFTNWIAWSHSLPTEVV